MKQIVIVILVTLVLFSGCLENGNSKSGDYTVDKLMENYNYKTHTFKGYTKGDTIIIRDTIKTIYYDIEIDRTLISFESMDTRPFAFTGENNKTNDLTSNYFLMPDQKVTVELHIHMFSNGEETIAEWIY